MDGWGFEGTLAQALGQYVELNVGLAWFDSEASDVQDICGGEDICEGRGLYWAPEWSGFATLNAHYPLGTGELFGMLSYNFQSEARGGFEPSSLRIDGWGEANLNLGYRGDNWSVLAYVENLTDEYHFDGGYNGDAVYPDYEFGPARPRTAGVRLSVSFD